MTNQIRDENFDKVMINWKTKKYISLTLESGSYCFAFGYICVNFDFLRLTMVSDPAKIFVELVSVLLTKVSS